MTKASECRIFDQVIKPGLSSHDNIWYIGSPEGSIIQQSYKTDDKINKGRIIDIKKQTGCTCTIKPREKGVCAFTSHHGKGGCGEVNNKIYPYLLRHSQ